MAENEPVHTIPIGRIRGAIWQNVNPDGESWFNVTVERRYKDGDKWRGSPSFRRDDLPLVAKVMDMAFAWIWDRQMAARSGQAES